MSAKLLSILLTRQLAKPPAVDRGIMVCTVNPGCCKSELMRNESPLFEGNSRIISHSNMLTMWGPNGEECGGRS